MIIIEKDEEYKFIKNEELQKIVDNKKFIFLIGMIAPPRPGVMPFATEIEYLYFPPGTKRNKDFIAVVSIWKEITWIIVGVPKIYMEKIKRRAGEFGLKIADGIPIMLEKGKIASFPIKGKNVFTFENVRGHEIYNKGLRKYKATIQDDRKKKQSKVKVIWDDE